jgi:hypothetical protein
MYKLLSLMIFALAGSTALRAEDVKWDDLCQRAGSRKIWVATKDRRSVSGECVGQTGSTISINTHQFVPTIKRANILSVRLEKRRASHCLARIGNAAEESLYYGFVALASPLFFLSPFYLAASPAILAGGAPFCRIYDLINRLTVGGTDKITII